MDTPRVPKRLIIWGVAQLGERSVRNAEVRGSIPLISTQNIDNPSF